MAMDPKTKTVAKLCALVAFMGAASFAAVPFYNWFCRVTGYAGETQRASADDAPHEVLEREITVRFDANVDSNMAWDFRPVQTRMKLKIGETGLAFYEAHNPTQRPIAGTASYNVAPYSTGAYFIKIACFCFNEQVLQPGETVQMPVTFYVDPELVEDDEAKYVDTITLSYTFHETPLPEAEAEKAAALKTGADSSSVN